MYRYRIFFAPISILLGLALFYFMEVNIDSQNRIDFLKKISLLEIFINFQIFREPFVLLLAKALQVLGLLSAYSLQLVLFATIFFLVLKITKERIILFPLLLIIPYFWLLFFNIQPMAISLLISYIILMPTYEFKTSFRYFTKDILLLFLAIGFHWVSLAFIPLIFLKHKKYFSLGIFVLMFFVLMIFVGFSVGEILQDIIKVYKEAPYNRNSEIHIQLSSFLAVMFIFLNLFFRSSNLILRFHCLIYLYVLILMAIVFVLFGYKPTSRIAFALDLWIFLDFIIFWIPENVKKNDYTLIYKGNNYINEK